MIPLWFRISIDWSVNIPRLNRGREVCNMTKKPASSRGSDGVDSRYHGAKLGKNIDIINIYQLTCLKTTIDTCMKGMIDILIVIYLSVRYIYFSHLLQSQMVFCSVQRITVRCREIQRIHGNNLAKKKNLV